VIESRMTLKGISAPSALQCSQDSISLFGLAQSGGVNEHNELLFRCGSNESLGTLNGSESYGKLRASSSDSCSEPACGTQYSRLDAAFR